MNYHELLLVPTTGHFGPSKADHGPCYGRYFEADITRQLIEFLEEDLDNDRIRTRVIKLWHPPGLMREQIAAEAAETTLSLHIAFGRGQGRAERKNLTKCWFSHPQALPLAQSLSEAAVDWAKCSNFHHEITAPKLREGFFPYHAILLEPYNLAAVEPEIYLLRLRDLAKTLSGVLAEYFLATNQAVRSKPMGAWANDKAKNSKDADKALVSNFLGIVEKIESQYGACDLDRDNDGKKDKPHMAKIRQL